MSIHSTSRAFLYSVFFSCLLVSATLIIISSPGKKGKISKMDRIDLAMEHELKYTRDPLSGVIPRVRLLEAERIRQERLLAMQDQRAVAGLAWEERGPSNIGGRTRAVLFDANDASNGYKKVWAGSVAGGLWYTNDITQANTQWHRVDDFLSNLAITTLAQNPANTQELYAGTGEGWFNADAVRGLGIWKSSDGGASWSQLASTNNSIFYYVQKIVVTSTGVILAATRDGGVRRSTDGGVSWTAVLANGLNGGLTNRAADLEIGADGTIYASMGIFTVDGIHRSTNGGAGWSRIYTSVANEQRIELATAPSNADVLYALVQDINGLDALGGTSDDYGIKRILRSINSTAGTPSFSNLTVPTWCDQGVNTADFTRGQAWYDLIAAVDPGNSDVVYIGGIDILKTTNGGTSWSQVSQWASSCANGAYVHADIHAMQFRPGVNNELLVGCDGGIFRTVDAGANFSHRNNGYNVTQYYATAIHPTRANYFLAGAQDNGTMQYTGPGINITRQVTGGDGAFCHMDQSTGNIQITSYVYNNYYVSNDGGVSFTTRSKNNLGQFINPTDYDDVANILYAGHSAGNYFRWLNVSTNGTSGGVAIANFAGASVTAVTVSPLTANRVFFGLDNSTVVMVDGAHGAGPTSQVIFSSPGSGVVNCIAVDPADENHMLVTFGSYGVTSVFESFNATSGSPSFASVEGDLPDMPVRWAMFDPRNSDWALLATELGVWTTDNLNGAGTNWNPTNSGLSNTRVDMLQYNSTSRVIAAATHGRGLFTTVVPSTTTPAVLFSGNALTISEQDARLNSCRAYKDHVINMVIEAPPVTGSLVTLSVAGGATATQGVDYDFTTNGSFTSPSTSFTFASNSTTAQAITIRVYDDSTVESSENFTLQFNLSGGSAIPGASNQTYTVTITDNDQAPIGSVNTVATIGTATANLGAPFAGANHDARSQMIYTASELRQAGFRKGTINSIAFNVLSKSSTQPYNNLTIRLKQTTNDSMRAGMLFETGGTIVYGPSSYSTTAGINNFTITPFAWDGVSNILVDVCFDNTSLTASDGVAGTVNQNKFHLAQGNSTAGCNFTTGNLAFSNRSRPDLRFDITSTPTPVETVLNTSRDFYLGANGDAYIYSAADGELLARVRNLSAHDYGCTEVVIDRAGTGATAFWNNNPANYLADKTFRLIPSNPNPSGSVEVTLYYTQAEISGWESATGQLWNNIQIVKVQSQISDVTPASPSGGGTVEVQTPTRFTLGANYGLTYSYTTGTGGYGAGIPGSAALPVNLLGFTGELIKDHVHLNWQTSREQNSRGFEIEKSWNGSQYRKLGYVPAAGFSSSIRAYNFQDPEKAAEYNYYRLKMLDLDNTFKYSQMVLIRNNQAGQQIQVLNNPFTDQVTIRFTRIPRSNVTVELFDFSGRKIYEAGYADPGSQILPINFGGKSMASGIYFLRVREGENSYQVKLVRN